MNRTCAFEGCGREENHTCHSTWTDFFEHQFQPQRSTEEAAPDAMGEILKRHIAEGDSCVCEPGSPCKLHGRPGAAQSGERATSSTDSRLAQIRERVKEFCTNRDYAVHYFADIPWLLTQLAEAQRERDDAHKSATLKIIAKLKTWVGRVGHEDYYKAQATLLEFQARCERAEAERDELKLKLESQ